MDYSGANGRALLVQGILPVLSADGTSHGALPRIRGAFAANIALLIAALEAEPGEEDLVDAFYHLVLGGMRARRRADSGWKAFAVMACWSLRPAGPQKAAILRHIRQLPGGVRALARAHRAVERLQARVANA